jgi:hypothetical protein
LSGCRRITPRALCATALTSAALATSGSPVLAYESYYNCELKPSGQWCDGRANGSYDGLNSWDYNEAWYPGTWNGTVTACQRLYKPSDGTTLTGNSCQANWTAYDYGAVTCSCYEAEAKQISGGAHSIWGYAIAN